MVVANIQDGNGQIAGDEGVCAKDFDPPSGNSVTKHKQRSMITDLQMAVFIRHRSTLRLGLLAVLWLVTTPSAWASNCHDLVGVWIVESVSPEGMIPETVTFTETERAMSGIWSIWSNWSSQDLQGKIEDVNLRDGVLSFTVRFGTFRTSWRGQFRQEERFAMTWRDEKDGHVVRTRLFRRASAEVLKEAKANAPEDLIAQRIPLPQLRALPSNGLASVPPMGWSSWNHFKETIDDQSIRQIADALVSSGLQDAGYIYVDIDDGWQGRRTVKGTLRPNAKFPDMKGLADYVHSKGLKFGIYSVAGPITCADYVGSHGYESLDATTFARWEIDLLKYDWCSAGVIYKTQADMQALYQKMGEALQATGRPIVYSVCQWGQFDVGSWGRKVGGNMWRTGGDSIEGKVWASVSLRFEQHGSPNDSGPGGWNDEDILLIGNGDMTNEEMRTHFTLWSMLASPLILGNDVRSMTPDIRKILLNREVIAIDQDTAGKQGVPVIKRGLCEVWVKPLADGSVAVALFNRGEQDSVIALSWADLNLNGPQKVRDLWRNVDLAGRENGYSDTLPAHGSVLLRVRDAR